MLNGTAGYALLSGPDYWLFQSGGANLAQQHDSSRHDPSEASRKNAIL
jgi:hypothetical protein